MNEVPHLPFVLAKNENSPLKESFDPDRYDPARLLHDVVRKCRSLPAGSLIGFHGFLGAGKTDAAKWVARQVGCQFADLDDFSFRFLRDFYGEGVDAGGFDHRAMLEFIAGCQNEQLTVAVSYFRLCEVVIPDVLVFLEGGMSPPRGWGGAPYDPSAFSGKKADFAGRLLARS
jgi:hypothetical protein